MPGDDSESLELLRKIHGLLELLAEEKIAQRDAKQRAALRKVAGTSHQKQSSIILMDGTRTQAEIGLMASMNKGNLSRLVAALLNENLLSDDTKNPKLAISVPVNFFDSHADEE
ncbi:MAG: hypothetical protein KL801_14900 [Mesorhizobium sp.]|nr:hypothetical protein [Mesorhizobium sp.]